VSAGNWWDIGWQVNRADTVVNFPEFNEIFREQSDSYDLYTTWNYALTWESYQLSPALSLGYQRTMFESQQSLLFRNDLRLRKVQIERSAGGYLSAGLATPYLQILTDSLVWIPSLTLGWTEPLWGDVSHANQIENMNAIVLRSQSGKRTDNSPGSGYLSASFLFLIC